MKKELCEHADACAHDGDHWFECMMFSNNGNECTTPYDFKDCEKIKEPPSKKLYLTGEEGWGCPICGEHYAHHHEF